MKCKECGQEIIDQNSPGQKIYAKIWAGLYPDIANALGETDLHKVHVMMKTRFNKRNCATVDEIPKRYLKKKVSIVTSNSLQYVNTFGHMLSFVEGTLLIEKNGVLDGYVIGLSVMTQEELEDYREQLTQYLYVDQAGMA